MAGQGTVSTKAFNGVLGRELISNATLVANAAVGSTLQQIKENSKFASIQAEGGDVKYTDDGTIPTAIIGMRLYDGQVLEYEGPLAALKFFAVSNAPQINVSYYK